MSAKTYVKCQLPGCDKDAAVAVSQFGVGVDYTCRGGHEFTVRPDSHIFDCGCSADQSTGLPISTCRRHDQRTREVKASAALMQMANCLDEAGPGVQESYHRVMLREAAKYAVKAAKALIGAETE